MRFPAENAINYNMVATLSSPKVIEIRNKKNNVTYLYEDRHYWDPDKKQTRHKRRCIGKLDPVTSQRIYNPTYKQKMAEQNQDDTQVVPNFQALGLKMLELFVEETSTIKSDLLSLFAKEDVHQLLYLAWYLLVTRRPLSFSLYWDEGREALYHGPSDWQEMQRLLQLFDAEKLRQWQAMQTASEQTCAVFDLCSVASYENHNPYLQYGYNRDSEALEQNTIILLTDHADFFPLSFHLLSGTMLGVRTIESVLAYLDVDTSTILMLNRRFFSLQRIEQLVEQNRSFLLRVPTRQRWLDECIARHRKDVEGGAPLLDAQKRVIRALQFDAPFLPDEHLQVHLFYDELWRNNQQENLLSLLAQCKLELEREERVEEHARLYETYFKVRKRNTGKTSALLVVDPLHLFNSSHAGFWALVTNTGLSSQQALDMYEKRNAFERRFDNLMNFEDCQNLQVHSPACYPGRVFLQLVSEKIRSVLTAALKEGDISIEQMLFSYSNLKEVSFGQSLTKYRKPLSEVQKQVETQLGFGLWEKSKV